MTTIRAELLQALRDAQAMESQAETLLRGHIPRLGSYPQLRARMEGHLGQTRSQRALVGQCLVQLGESPLAPADAATVRPPDQAPAGAVSDEALKGVIACYALERMEVGAYRILIALAQSAGEREVQRICERILPEEEAMASWLEQHMMDVAPALASRADAAVPAGVAAGHGRRADDRGHQARH